MLSHQAVAEFRHRWLPNLSRGGIEHLARLLRAESTQLLRGAFSPDFETAGDDYFQIASSGCLSTHAGWLHPVTEQLHWDAGIAWLEDVVGLRTEQSAVIEAWDSGRPIEAELLFLLEEERSRRVIADGEVENPASVPRDDYRRNRLST